MDNDDGAGIRLIVNADDFGASAAVNEGVAQAHREGVVTSATVLAGGRAYDHALSLLDDLPALGVGVHLALAAAPAVLAARAAPTLVDEAGVLPQDAAAFARQYFAGRVALADVGAELGAQIAKVRDAGVHITHLDSHQHLHNLPGVAGIVLELARRFGVRAVRSCRCRLRPFGRGWLGRQLALRLMAEAFDARARRGGMKSPDGLLGQEASGALTPARLAAIIGGLEAGTWELMCHPAAAPDADAPLGYDRPGELAALLSAEVAAALEERGIRLVNFAAL